MAIINEEKVLREKTKWEKILEAQDLSTERKFEYEALPLIKREISPFYIVLT